MLACVSCSLLLMMYVLWAYAFESMMICYFLKYSFMYTTSNEDE